ncbi:MAG TPA: hypothetical protein VF519_00870 [Mycobacteriales bacterium]|jgi:DNA-binding beta-propeller fold protein YncE
MNRAALALVPLLAVACGSGPDPVRSVAADPVPSSPATVSATPSPTATGSAPPVPDLPFAAVTERRVLALASYRTGEVTRTVATLDATAGSVDLSPDGRHVLVTLLPPGGLSYDADTRAECPRVVEYDVATGTRRDVAPGFSARYAPDGRVAMATCPGDGVRIVPGATYAARTWVASVAWSPDGRAVYVQEAGDDSNAFVRLDPATDRSLADAERVAVTFVTTMNDPVPWRDRLLHTTSIEGEPREVRVATSYRDGMVAGSDLLLTLPAGGDPITTVHVGPGDALLVVAGDELWRWAGAGEPVRLARAYAAVGW